MAARAARSGVKLLHVVDTTALKSIVQQAVRTHVDDDVWAAMRQQGIQTASMSEQDAADLFAYLKTLR